MACKLASDIHFEPEGQFLRIRYRIDGVLRQVRVLHGRYWSAMLVRLRLVAGMNIAESRAPQDGRVSLSIGGRNVDFRAAVQPPSTAKTSCCACSTPSAALSITTSWG